MLWNARMAVEAGVRQHDGIDAGVPVLLAHLVDGRTHIARPFGARLDRVHAAQRANDIRLRILGAHRLDEAPVGAHAPGVVRRL